MNSKRTNDRVYQLNNNKSILKILIKTRHGFLSQLYLRLEGAGYSVLKHQIKPSLEEGLEVIELLIAGKLPLPEKLTTAIIAMPECIDFIDGAGNVVDSSKESTETKQNIQQLSKSVTKKVVSVFPNVTMVLERAVDNVEPSDKAALLTNIGQGTGGVIYEDNYSLGLPMKLTPFIKRVLLPTLKPIADMTYRDNEIYLRNNSCCSSNKANSKCDFVKGMVEGLLDANKATQNVRVERTSCVSNGDSNCTFYLV